ncbi:hypothetical protein C8R43DRAFT_956093 [Mycena crocata]|nr:hypothetical protein C8R43DRAFT_956093 [Mycena crocata]
MNPPNDSPISKAMRNRELTVYQQNPGPVEPVPYNTQGLTFEAASGTHLAGSDAQGYKDWMPYTSAQNEKFIEQGNVHLGSGKMKFNLAMPPAGCARARLHSLPTPITATSQFDDTSSEGSDPVPSIASSYHNRGVDEQRVRQLSKKVTRPEREYGNYEVPPPRGYNSPSDIQWHISLLESYQQLVTSITPSVLGQHREIALIGRHTEDPQKLVLLNRPRRTLSGGTEMVCLGGLDAMWYVTQQQTEDGNFYSNTWVHHGIEKRVEVLVPKEYCYSVPSKWKRAYTTARNLLKVAIRNRPSTKATSTTHLPNF